MESGWAIFIIIFVIIIIVVIVIAYWNSGTAGAGVNPPINPVTPTGGSSTLLIVGGIFFVIIIIALIIWAFYPTRHVVPVPVPVVAPLPPPVPTPSVTMVNTTAPPQLQAPPPEPPSITEVHHHYPQPVMTQEPPNLTEVHHHYSPPIMPPTTSSVYQQSFESPPPIMHSAPLVNPVPMGPVQNAPTGIPVTRSRTVYPSNEGTFDPDQHVTYSAEPGQRVRTEVSHSRLGRTTGTLTTNPSLVQNVEDYGEHPVRIQNVVPRGRGTIGYGQTASRYGRTITNDVSRYGPKYI